MRGRMSGVARPASSTARSWGNRRSPPDGRCGEWRMKDVGMSVPPFLRTSKKWGSPRTVSSCCLETTERPARAARAVPTTISLTLNGSNQSPS